MSSSPSSRPDNSAVENSKIENAAVCLQRSAELLASQAQQLYRWRAALWCCALWTLTTTVLVAFDYFLHVEEAGLRWLLTGAWLVVIFAITYRLVPEAVRFSLRPVRIAEWIERTRPELRGRLSNTLAILELPDEDARFGSSSFRSAALGTAAPELLAVDWRSFLDFKPTLRAGAMCTVACLLAIGLCVSFPPLAGRGLQRILIPWHTAPWPRADQLQFVNLPEMIAAGTELSIEVIDRRPPLPAALELQTRTLSGGPSAQEADTTRLPMRVLGDVAVVTLPEMRSDFSLRVIGGDDEETEWHQVRVAELPELLEHEFRVQPPAYTLQPDALLVGERIEVLAGSRVTFHGKYNGRLREVKAELTPVAHFASQSVGPTPSLANAIATTTSISSSDVNMSATANQSSTGDASASQPTSWIAALDNDETEFELFQASSESSLIDRDRRWQLHIITDEGLRLIDPKNWTIHAVPDRAPSVNMLPLEPSLITREASVVIAGQATDDLGLVDVSLVWQTLDSALSGRRSLWSAPPLSPLGSDSTSTTAGTSAQQTSPQWTKQIAINYQWQPHDDQLTTGQSISIFLEGRDSFGQLARSVSQTVEIQEAQAVLAHLQSEEAKTFEPLRQLLDSQRRNLQSLQRTRDIVHDAEQLSSAPVDALATSRQVEQAIAQQLARAPGSVLSKLRTLSHQLDRNGLSESAVATQVEQLANKISELSGKTIEPALKELDEAQSRLRSALEEPTDKARAAAIEQLDKAMALQQRATEQLNMLVVSIATAETLADLQGEFNELLSQQISLQADTQRLQVDHVVNPSSTLSDSKRIGLRSDQQSLARAVDDLTSKIDAQLRKKPANDQHEEQTGGNGETHRTLQRARQALVDHQVSQRMRAAADMVEASQLTDAMAAQRAAAEALELAAGKFGSLVDGNLASSSANLQDIAHNLADLQQRQLELAENFTEKPGATSSASLARQQKAIVDEADALINEIRPASGKDGLDESLSRGKAHASAASEHAREERLDEAAKQAAHAAEEFRQARASAEQRAAELEKQLAAQQLLDLRSTIVNLVRRQTPIVDSLKKMKESRASASTATVPDALPNDSQALRETAKLQEQVRQQLLGATAQAQSLETFAWLLAQCETDMARAVAALERMRLEPDALQSAESALQKLSAAEQALSQTADAKQPAGDEAAAADQDDQQQSKSGQSERRPALASLKLLRALQSNVNQQTVTLQANGVATSEPEFLRLADEQQALADQTEKLIRELAQQPSHE